MVNPTISRYIWCKASAIKCHMVCSYCILIFSDILTILSIPSLPLFRSLRFQFSHFYFFFLFCFYDNKWVLWVHMVRQLINLLVIKQLSCLKWLLLFIVPHIASAFALLFVVHLSISITLRIYCRNRLRCFISQ